MCDSNIAGWIVLGLWLLSNASSYMMGHLWGYKAGTDKYLKFLEDLRQGLDRAVSKMDKKQENSTDV